MRSLSGREVGKGETSRWGNEVNAATLSRNHVKKEAAWCSY